MKFRLASTPFSYSLGKRGEDLASEFLVKEGYEILHRNMRCGKLGEIDIVAKRNGKTHIIEVKTRTSRSFGLPQESVNFSKQKKLVQCALWYTKWKKQPSLSVQIDVIAIEWAQTRAPKITHLMNAVEQEAYT